MTNNTQNSGDTRFSLLRNMTTSITLILAVCVPCIGKSLLVSPEERSYETTIVSWFHKNSPSFLAGFSNILATVFSTKGCIVLIILLAILSYIFIRDWHVLLIQLLISLLPMVYIFAVKFAVHRPRPYIGLSLKLPPDPSFPSGHTSAAVAVCTMLMLIIYVVKPKLTQIMLILCGVVVIIVAISRLIVAAHFPTDVLAAAIIYPLLSATLLKVFQNHGLYISNEN